MTTDPNSQFDFWLGTWDVTWGDDGAGTNHVLRIMDGKVIQENFSAPGLQGMSVSVYDPERQLWCQTWVDNNGSYLDFTGQFADGKMTLVRNAIVQGAACQQRMVWYNLAPDGFDWNWERSDDGGQTWQVKWQIRYTRR